MTDREVLQSVEDGLERLLLKTDISGDDDIIPGLRIAIIYIRSRIDASIDMDATTVVGRALPAPERPGEGVEEPGTGSERTTEMFDTGRTSSRSRRKE